ncbi:MULTISPECIES: hypothetical protein [unclassified Helicobacter]|nr:MULTISPECIES: hypothetical protein [unclassified Helicobacter]
MWLELNARAISVMGAKNQSGNMLGCKNAKVAKVTEAQNAKIK